MVHPRTPAVFGHQAKGRVAQFAALQQAADGQDRRIVASVLGDGDLEATLGCLSDDLPSLAEVFGEGLFDQYVLTGTDCL